MATGDIVRQDEAGNGAANQAFIELLTTSGKKAYAPAAVTDVAAATTAITTQNLVPAGAATAGSAAQVSPAGRSGLTIQVVGAYTGALSLQGTVDGVNWITIGGTPLLNVATGAVSANIPSATQGIFMTDCSGFLNMRIAALAAVTGTANVTMRCSEQTSILGISDPLPAGTNSIGSVSASPNAQLSSLLNSAASTNATVAKASSGQVLAIAASNNGAAAAFLKLYNKATAPTVGTDVPVMVIPIPASGFVNFPFEGAGILFNAGISYAITNLIADSDTTAVAAAQVKVALSYK